MQALRFQIELALAHDLPVAIHTRDAWDEMRIAGGFRRTGFCAG